MNLSKRSVFILVLLLIVLNFILRFPTTPHEIGYDSFEIHCIANSVSEFGYVKWWVHPASIFGFYPYSYASVVPFFLSGISQCTGVDMEWTIWLFCILIGLLSAFTAYLMAGAIRNDTIFKYLVAFAYSTSTGILWLTTWTVSTRGLFVVLLPLFIYLLLKCRTSIAKYSALTFILFAVLLTTHHLFYFIAPVVLSYTTVTIFYKLKDHIKFDRIPQKVVCFALPICFIGMFAIPFFTRSFMKSGTRYGWLLETQLPEYARMIGLLGIFIVGGLSYLMFKQDKSFEEWFLLLAVMSLTPLLYVGKYTKWFFLAFAFLVIGVALTNIAKIKTHISKKKTVIFTLIILLSISFTGYYQYLHFLNDSGFSRHMEERTYVSALWIKNNVDTGKNMIVASHITNRVFSISEVPTLTGTTFNDLSYGFVDPNELEVERIHSPLSVGFYSHNPYKITVGPDTSWICTCIRSFNVNEQRSSYAQRWFHKLNFSYFVETEDVRDRFTRSVWQTKDNIYGNGKIRIWNLNHNQGR